MGLITASELELQSQKNCIKNEEEWQPVNIHGAKQEVIRRNIEACVSVLKMSNPDYRLSVDTRTAAENQMLRFINALSVSS